MTLNEFVSMHQEEHREIDCIYLCEILNKEVDNCFKIVNQLDINDLELGRQNLKVLSYKTSQREVWNEKKGVLKQIIKVFEVKLEEKGE